MGFIPGLVGGPHGIPKILPIPDSPFGKPERPVTHQKTIRIGGPEGEAERGKRIIHRCRDILQGIGQGSVQIKENRFNSFLHFYFPG